jgi:polar amino acid transport system permease protein
MSSPTAPTEESARDEEVLRVVVRRRPYLWVVYAVLAVILVAAGYSAATNQRFGWGVVATYFLSSAILKGLLMTLELTVVSMLFGIVLGVLLAMMAVSRTRVLARVSRGYVWFFRGTPLLVQLLFWEFVAALYPRIAIGIPFGPAFIHANANTLITPFAAAILGLALNEGAYMAEIVRSGIISVGEGQTEAAMSLGMSRLQTMRRIVLPQAMRVIVPPTGNETISMLKNTVLVSVIGYAELLYEAQQIYAVTYQTIPLLIVASIWYLVLTSVSYVGQYFIERRFGRGFSREERAPMRRRWLSFRHDAV